MCPAEHPGRRQPAARSHELDTVVIVNDGQLDESAACARMLRDKGFRIRMAGDDRFSSGLASEGEAIELLRGASAVIAQGERYPAAVLESLPDLRVIARFGVGFDRVDIPAATANDLVVVITPNSNHEAVAEHALGLMLAVARSIASLDRRMRAGEWPNRQLLPLRGSSLGIVGLGRIGRSLAVRAKAMKMKIRATEPEPDEAFVGEHGVELVDLDTLLRSSDYVSLHCPLSDETRGMIDGGKLKLMKPGAALINTARGGLVVEADLVDALESRRIGGAGLDVFEQEPTDPENPLFGLDTVVVSPHCAGSDELSWEQMGMEAARLIIELSNGGWPDGAVVNDELREKWQW